MASHLAEVAIRRKVSVQSDIYYSTDAQALGAIAWHAFGGAGKSKSQIAELENITVDRGENLSHKIIGFLLKEATWETAKEGSS